MNPPPSLGAGTPYINRWWRSVRVAIPFLASLVLVPATLHARPSITSASLRLGLTPSVQQFSWATLTCGLRNPDPESRVIEIRFRNSTTGFQGMRTIFTDRVTLPPKSTATYRSLVMLETSEKYNLELFCDGKRIGQYGSLLVKLRIGNKQTIAILNDSQEATFGASDSARVLKRFSPVFFTAKTPIIQQRLLAHVRFVIVLKPDFAKYQTRTFQAILDYVRSGGTLIFADPIGSIAAADTPLAPLLPVTPLKLREISTLPALKSISPSFSNFVNPVAFLESEPKPHSMVPAKAYGCPVLAWKRFGMGLVGFTAFPLSSDVVRGDEWNELLQPVFAGQRLENDNTPVIKALDEMTGLTTPPVSTARSLVLTYLLILAIPLALGLYFKKNGLAWLSGGLVAAIFTLHVLHRATKTRGQGRKAPFVAFVEVTIPGMDSSTTEAYYSVMSPFDRSIAIKTNTEQAALCALPPPDNATLIMMSQRPGRPLIVERGDGTPAIPDLKLATNAPRQFKASLDGRPSNLASLPLPELTLDKTGLALTPWTVPKGISPSAALLLLPRKALPLNIKNGKISLPTRGRLLGAGTIERSVKAFLENGWRHSMPAVAIIENNDTPQLSVPDGTIAHGRKITIFPATVSAASGKIYLGPEWTTLYPGSPTTKLVMEGNHFRSKIISRGNTSYLVRFDIPPPLSTIKPTRITLDFSYSNQGKNVRVVPLLAAVAHTANGVKIAKTWNGKKTGDGKLVFENLDGFMSMPGRGYVLLKVSLRNRALPDTSFNVNAWSVEKFYLSVYGEMPETMAKGFSL